MKKSIIIVFLFSIVLMITPLVITSAETLLPSPYGSITGTFNKLYTYEKSFKYEKPAGSSGNSYEVINKYRPVFLNIRDAKTTFQIVRGPGETAERLYVFTGIYRSTGWGHSKEEINNSGFAISSTAKYASWLAYPSETFHIMNSSNYNTFSYSFHYTAN